MINHLFLWAIYTMTMLNNQMVLHPTTSLPSIHPSKQSQAWLEKPIPSIVPPRHVPGFCSTPRWHRARPRPKWRCVALGGATGNPTGRRRCHSAPGTVDFMDWFEEKSGNSALKSIKNRCCLQMFPVSSCLQFWEGWFHLIFTHTHYIVYGV